MEANRSKEQLWSESFELLNSVVYPAVDVVGTSKLDRLHPKGPYQGESGTHYQLDCPRCGSDGRGRAFYYVGSGAIVCNRKDKCKATSIWDALSTSLSSKEILQLLFSAAGIELPICNTESKILSVDMNVRNILSGILMSKRDVLKAFMEQRNLSLEDVRQLGYGYYPGAAYLKSILLKEKIDIGTCVARGYIPDPTDSTDHDRFRNRIVGMWETPASEMFIWGRTLERNPKKPIPKYKFTKSDRGFTKTAPYGFFRGRHKTLYLTEGTFDADSLYLVKGFWSAAIGSNSINRSQGVFLAQRNVKEAILVTDGDAAGTLGALQSIFNVDDLGVNLRICSTPKDVDDIDSLRASNNIQQIDSILKREVEPHIFITRCYKKALVVGDTKVQKLIFTGVSKLSSTTRDKLSMSMQEERLTLSPERDAVSMLRALLTYGSTLSEARKSVLARYGLDIRFERIR